MLSEAKPQANENPIPIAPPTHLMTRVLVCAIAERDRNHRLWRTVVIRVPCVTLRRG
jgi:hypothetical protein